MEVQTVDAMAGGGRVIAGLGVSGPQIVEGWYGAPWGKPYYRLKDYITIMRKIFERKEPVAHDGPEISLPYRGPGSAGMGKPLQSILHMNPKLPIFLRTGNPSNLRLAGQLCDGVLPLRFVPSRIAEYREPIEEGFRRAGNGKSWADFEFMPTVSVTVTDDVRAALREMKPHIALYVGGMGHPDLNFHNQQMVRSGYGEAAQRIQELYLAGRKAEALEEVPDEYCDEMALVGPPARIAERYRAWEDSGITGLIIGTRQYEALELMAEIAGAGREAVAASQRSPADA
jgi:F420-dependent oxidoreductase-like protein